MNDSKKYNYLTDFRFDSNLGIVTIDGHRIDSITDIKIEREKGARFSKVTLKLDANVEVEGKLLLIPNLLPIEEMKEIVNPPQND